ncbi:MAG: flavodoxin family protein, partial [Oscillospiraceae bacterium]
MKQWDVVYDSRTGNTKRIAEAIYAALPAAARGTLASLEEAAQKPAPKALFFGFWVDRGSCSEAAQQYLTTLGSCEVALFATAGMGGAPEYYEEIAARVMALLPQDSGYRGSWFGQGRMPETVRARYEGRLAQQPGDPRLLRMIETYDRALGHPDEADL